MKNKRLFGAGQMVSAVVMIVALAWLTVSLPFVNEDRQQAKAMSTQTKAATDPDNPFSNTTEEKTETGNNSLSEYLHELHAHQHDFVLINKYYKCHPSDLYFEYHPELLSPPPEA